MSNFYPAVSLHAAITLDGRLADPGIELHEGPTVTTVDAHRAGRMLAVNYIRELHLTVRPRIDGRRDSPTLSGPPTPEFFPRSLSCRLLRIETRDGECLLHYRIAGRTPARTSRR